MLKPLLLASALVASSVYANVVITGTRVIYPSDQNSISVQLQNTGNRPSLVQVWLDDGKKDVDPTTLKLPFILTPPVSRIDPATSQTIRIRHTGTPLPQDRESLYYFNMLDIPPKPELTDDNANYLQFTLRSRLKFFYRPAKLPYPVSEAYSKVTWRLTDDALIAHNPTPYYITYSTIELMQQDQVATDITDADMVAPFSEQKFRLSAPVTADSVAWRIINDYGGYHGSSSPLINP